MNIIKKFKLKKLENKINSLKIDMLNLYKRGRDTDTINLIKKKNIKLKKLEEDYNKMAKLEIKNGKLQPVDDSKESPAPTKEELEEKRKVREVEMEAIERREVEEMFNKAKAKPKDEPNPVVTDEGESEITEEDIQRFKEHELARREAIRQQELARVEAIRQQQLEQEELMRQQMLQEELARREAIKVQSREPQEPQLYKVRITLFPGTPVTIDILEDDFESFIANIKEAVNTQTTMYLGENSVVNGRYIIRYDVL